MWRAGRNGRKTQSTTGGSGNFNKLRELTYKACFRLLQERWIPAPTQHILRVYIGALTCFSQEYSVGVLIAHHYLQAMSLELPLGAGKAGGSHIPRVAGEEPPSAPVHLRDQSAVMSF